MALDDYIQSLLNYRGFAGDIVCHREIKAAEALYETGGRPEDPVQESILRHLGIDSLYAHQAAAIDLIKSNCHTVIATPTASGKSLIYNIPVLSQLAKDSESTALYLFPLKALARDQLATVQQLLKIVEKDLCSGSRLSAAVYDGDVSAYQKKKIRQQPPHILLTNPEMLHLSLLACHDLWKSFFRQLRYVIVDEVHTYRGVMGSNMAWVFRRLLRICEIYGSRPVFIFCSATIANPVALTRMLTGLDVALVDKSTAPTGKKQVVLMKGMAGAAKTAVDLVHAAMHRRLRTIVYTQSRKITELIAIWSSERVRSLCDKISAYRAGFLPDERREIEQRLSSGDLLTVVSTSALELGIDIGNLDICILVGYPGTIMSTWQRAGRVGREGNDSLLILVAHEDALDQYFVNHPEEFFTMPPETAIINPENEIIRQNHLECAAAEFALAADEALLKTGDVFKAVEELEAAGRLLKSEQGKLWYAARQSPHRHVNLRGTGTHLSIFLQGTKTVLGEMDRHRAFFEAHEGAVYLHRGESYVIVVFDHEQGVIQARPGQVNYFTRAMSHKDTSILEVLETKTVKGTSMGYGRLKISEQVTGYQKKQANTGKTIGTVPLDLPVIEFETLGMWIDIPDSIKDCIESMRLHFMGGIHALEHAVIGILPLLIMTDRNDLGGISIPHHPQTRRAAVFVYDGVPGGLGLTKTAFERASECLEYTSRALAGCKCETGCPSCVHSPKCGSGNRPIDKAACIQILDMLMMDTGVQKIPALPGRIHITREVLDRPVQEQEQIKQPVSYAVLDVETQKSAAQVGGWHLARKMQVSCAVVYNSITNEFVPYLQKEIPRLVEDLKSVDLVIGFNLVRFDYQVLSGVCDFDFHSLPTLDLLISVHNRLGYRLSLDHLAKETLGAKKSADGLKALEWWAEGRIDDIIEYCTQDVRVTRDLYLFGKSEGYLLFRNKAKHKVRVPVDW